MTEIPIAALNQYTFCPHRCWRMFCAGEFVDNEYTIEGTSLHDRVHTLGEGDRGDTWQVRAIWLKSDRYQLVGKSDLVELEGGRIYPVEYKRGSSGKLQSREEEFANDAVQVCAQALCLEEMTGQSIPMGYLYYASSHQRKPVELSKILRQQTIEKIAAVRHLFESGEMPTAVYKQRCKGCSLRDRCLPLAIDRVNRYREI